jgi:serine/threonine protein phosphatase PrpC
VNPVVTVKFQAKGAAPFQEDGLVEIPEKRIFLVADGFGGAAGADSGGQKACEAVRNFLVKEAGDLEATLPFIIRNYYSLAGNVLFNALIHANRQLVRSNREKSVHEKIGSSVIAGWLDGDLLAIANVGACGAWLFHGGEVRELVLPRNLARLQNVFGGGNGSMNASEEAARAALRVPLMALGTAEDLEPEIVEYRIRPGDWVLFGSSGIDEEIRSILAQAQVESARKSVSPEELTTVISQLLENRTYSGNTSILLNIF